MEPRFPVGSSNSIYNEFFHRGTTASIILSTLAGRPSYQNQTPFTSSLANFIPSISDIHVKPTGEDVSILSTDSRKSQIEGQEEEPEACKKLKRALRDAAGPWTTYRFDMNYWTHSNRTKTQAIDDFDGILTKQLMMGTLSKLERCPEFYHYAYTKCVLVNKKLLNIDILRQYQYIQFLDLSFNNLTTLKPLGNLPFLKILDASHNQLSTILDFKASYFLTTVNISYNKFLYMRDLSEFWSITDLNLSHNKIRIISGITNLRYLATLNLSFNRIEKIENLSGLRVQFLFLHNNCIRVVEEDNIELYTLKNLRLINLSYNHIYSLKMFEKVENLEFLDCVNNNLSKLLDIYYLRNLTYLHKLNLTGNPVTNFPRYSEVCVAHIKNLILLDNERLDSDHWLERMSNQTLDIYQKANRSKMKLLGIEQTIPPQIWSWLPPYDEPPIAAIILVGLQASRHSYIAKKFSKNRQDVAVGIAYTTRPKHDNELDGEYFNFINNETFNRMLKNGEFFTYEEVLGSYYGIAHNEFLKAKNSVIMFYTDLTMALSIKRCFLNTIFVLALPSTDQVHLQTLNFLYAVTVQDDGTVKVLNSPAMAEQYRREAMEQEAQEVMEEILTKICNLSGESDDENSSESEKQSEILQLSQSSNPNKEGNTLLLSKKHKNDHFNNEESKKKIKRYVSFTVAHTHKIYESSNEKPCQKLSLEEQDSRKIHSTKFATPSEDNTILDVKSCVIVDVKMSPTYTNSTFSNKSCSFQNYTETLSKDPRMKWLFDEELRKREELLELYLDMPGLFRELCFTDKEEETLNKLEKLVKDVNQYNKTTTQSILSLTKDKSFQEILDRKIKNCFTEINREVSTSDKQTNEYLGRVYYQDCGKDKCKNPTCKPWIE